MSNRIPAIAISVLIIATTSFLAMTALGATGSTDDQWSYQGTSVIIEEAGVRLDPASSESATKMSAKEAVSIAHDDAGLEPTQAPAKTTLVTFTDLHWKDQSSGERLVENVPAWVVTFQDICVPFYGPTPEPKCAGTELHVVIDSRSGEYIEAFSYR